MPEGEGDGAMENVKAVIFDWAGTVVDYGSLAPMGAFVDTFTEFGVTISIDEARGPMGMAKRPHIAAIMALPRVASEWAERRGHSPSDSDIDAVYAAFVPKNIAVAARYAGLIPGVAEVVAELRRTGVKIGSTTGYTRDIMAKILPIAGAEGFAPDSLVCTGDTPDGRPTPFMLYKSLLDLRVWPAWDTIKVDDTEVGIGEGINAGAWAVGVAVSGNLFGLPQAEAASLSRSDYERKRATAEAKLRAAGAHYVIDSVADLMPVARAIDARRARGERP
jgi:phosphonoacetaldehyde hydrolase